jgi:hypothetical protein
MPSSFVLGSLMYGMLFIRPDMYYEVGILCRYTNKHGIT